MWVGYHAMCGGGRRGGYKKKRNHPCPQGAFSVPGRQHIYISMGFNVLVTMMRCEMRMTTELWEVRGQELQVRTQCHIMGSGRPA